MSRVKPSSVGLAGVLARLAVVAFVVQLLYGNINRGIATQLAILLLQLNATQRHLLVTIFAFQTFEDEISATVLDNLCVDLVHAEGDAGLLFHNPEVCHLEVIDALVLYFARNGEVEVMHIDMVNIERVATLVGFGLDVPLEVGAADDGIIEIQIDLYGAFLLGFLLFLILGLLVLA